MARRVRFALPEGAEASVRVYDLLGREVARLASGPFAAGRHGAWLDGTRLPAGAYAVVLETGGRRWVQRVAVLR